jgi:molecular chaperone GrpE
MTEENNETKVEQSTSEPKGESQVEAKGESKGESQVEAQAESVDPIAELKAERDRYKDAALRALADLDNFRKRSIREREEAAKKAREDVLRELLPVFDNLDRASQFVGSSVDMAAVAKGIEMVLKLFEDTLGRLGGRRLRSVGQVFDPQVHEAIAQEPSELPAGVVCAEHLAGYMLGDRLLRAAMVVVSTGPAATASAQETNGEKEKKNDEHVEPAPSKG